MTACWRGQTAQAHRELHDADSNSYFRQGTREPVIAAAVR